MKIFKNDNGCEYYVFMQYIYDSKRLLLLGQKNGNFIIAIGAPKNNKGSWEHGRYYDKNNGKKAMADFLELCEEKNTEI